ncbi:hypothetical protein CEK27_004094 [Fusarium fujikuroi]|nr:hypothetical protein CEK27_004094 [Fusarium fujikuroi]
MDQDPALETPSRDWHPKHTSIHPYPATIIAIIVVLAVVSLFVSILRQLLERRLSQRRGWFFDTTYPPPSPTPSSSGGSSRRSKKKRNEQKVRPVSEVEIESRQLLFADTAFRGERVPLQNPNERVSLYHTFQLPAPHTSRLKPARSMMELNGGNPLESVGDKEEQKKAKTIHWHGARDLSRTDLSSSDIVTGFYNTESRPLRLVLILLLTLLRLLRGGRLLAAALVASLVHLVEEVQAGNLELIGLLLDLGGGGGALTREVLGDELTEIGDLLLDGVGLSLVELVSILVESTLGIVQDAVSTVGSLDSTLALLVGLSVLLGVLNHLLNLALRETGTGSNGDGLVLVGGLVLGVNVDDGVSVNVEGHLDLRDTTVSRGDTNKLEISEKLVILDELTLTLVDLDLDGSLEIGCGGEDLRLFGGDSGVSVDQTGEDTTEGLNTEGQRGNIEKEEILDLTREDSTLNSSTDGNSLIGVDGLGGIAAENALDGLSNLGHTGHTTNEDDLLDLLSGEASILEGLADGLDGAGDERVNHLLKLSSAELHVDVLGTRGVGSDERKVDIGRERRRKLDLGLLSSLTDTLDSHAVTRQVNARGLLEVLDKVADEVDIEILTTEVGVTVGGLDLEDTVLDLEDRDIEGTTTKIVDSDNAVSLLLKTVGKGGGSRLVDDTENVETGNLTGILGALSLRVVEVSGDGDDGVLDGLGEVGLGGLLHLVEDETTNLRRRVVLATSSDPGVAVGVLDDFVRDLLDITLNLSILELASY